jgi:hypothetical protein
MARTKGHLVDGCRESEIFRRSAARRRSSSLECTTAQIGHWREARQESGVGLRGRDRLSFGMRRSLVEVSR